MSRATSAWSNYWASGKTSTFGRLDDLSAGQPLIELWSTLFVPNEDQAVLDLGCGNGALGQILLEIAAQSEREITVTGVDSANLPDSESPTEGMTLYGNTAMEDLPFDDEVFDRVVSQFGFEYVEPAKALPELHRVLRANGTVTIIGHHRSSYVCRDSFDIIRQMAEAEESALMVSVERLLTRLDMLRAEKKQPEKDKIAEDLRKVVNATVQELERSAKASANPGFTIQFLNSVMEVFKRDGGSLAAHREYLQELSQAIVEYRERLNSQKDVALDQDAWESMREQFSQKGFEVSRFEPSVVNGFHFGHLIEARKLPGRA